MPTDTPMQLGMIGLGRMSSNLVRRLMRDGRRYVTQLEPYFRAPQDRIGGQQAGGEIYETYLVARNSFV